MAFDTVLEALDYIDSLPKPQKDKARLSNTLIEGVYNKRGQLDEGLYEWYVR